MTGPSPIDDPGRWLDEPDNDQLVPDDDRLDALEADAADRAYDLMRDQDGQEPWR